MAFDDPIVIADNSAANQSFTRKGVSLSTSEWIENDATSTNIRTLSIKHASAGPSVQKGSPPVRRHLVQFKLNKWNSILMKMEAATVNVTLTVDPGSTITAANIYDLMAFQKNLLSTTVIDQLMRDET